jgi:hypothetical protein
MKPIKRGLEEFLLSEKYVKNTQASTHKHYGLEILEIFKIRRHGGKMTIQKPFKISIEDFSNNKLCMNFVAWVMSRLKQQNIGL